MKPAHTQIVILVLYVMFLSAIFLVYNSYIKQIGHKWDDLINIKQER